jgi:hypothetical protein
MSESYTYSPLVFAAEWTLSDAPEPPKRKPGLMSSSKFTNYIICDKGHKAVLRKDGIILCPKCNGGIE